MAVTLLLAAGAAWAAGEADGIIVKLRDAPAHADVAREKAQSGDQRSARGEAARQKLDRVLREAAVDQPGTDVPSVPRIRSSGRDAQLLRYDRLLTQDEAARLVQRLRERPDVEWAVPNTLEQRQQAAAIDKTSTPSDPLFGGFDQQWWLFQAQGVNTNVLNARLRGVPGFQKAWADHGNGIGMTAAPVAVLDSGILFDHPDLPASQLLPGYDFVSSATAAGDGDAEDNNPQDEGDFCGKANSTWHGTKIAGLIAAQTNNNQGVGAIHWAGRVLPVRIAGRCGASVADIVNGIRWAAGLDVEGLVNPNPVRVINISFGGTAACDEAYQAAIDEVRSAKGAVVIAAAGNEQKAPTRPANCKNVIGVGALNRDGFKANYSNFGAELVLSTVGGDLSTLGAWGPALGDSGLYTISNNGTSTPGSPTYERVFGTSFSAPLVSGAVSLMLGLNPRLTADQIVDGLTKSSREHVKSAYIGACSSSNPGRCICSTATCGAGILDADQALAFAQAPDSYARPSLLDTDVVVDSADVISAVNANAQDVTTTGTTTTTPAGPCGRDNVCGGAVQPLWLLGLLAASGALLLGRRGRVAGNGVRA